MPEISVPGDVDVVVGETLTIQWRKKCKFCVNSNTGATFEDQNGNPLPLPAGGDPAGEPWVGIAKTPGVIHFHHTDPDGDCDNSSTGTGGRTISVSGS